MASARVSAGSSAVAEPPSPAAADVADRHSLDLPCMGTEVLLAVETSDREAALEALAKARRFLEDFDARLSRFSTDSELARLNANPAATVPASDLLRTAIGAALRVARQSGGLIEPTVIDALEALGYTGSETAEPVSLREALRLAPPRKSAAPNRSSRWGEVTIDDRSATITRPAGVRFDLGGSGKGLAADMLAADLEQFSRYAVDCGGDLNVGGRVAARNPHEIAVADPFEPGESLALLAVDFGGVATSGIDVHLWRDSAGGYRHHLIDPSAGSSAWTGLVAVTALGRSAVEAEFLSKLALLSGPAAARDLLREQGGLVVDDDGEVEAIGPIRARRL